MLSFPCCRICVPCLLPVRHPRSRPLRSALRGRIRLTDSHDLVSLLVYAVMRLRSECPQVALHSTSPLSWLPGLSHHPRPLPMPLVPPHASHSYTYSICVTPTCAGLNTLDPIIHPSFNTSTTCPFSHPPLLLSFFGGATSAGI